MKRSWMICDGMYFIAFLDTEFYLINAKVTEKKSYIIVLFQNWMSVFIGQVQLWKTKINSLPTFAQHEVYLSLI